MIWHSSLVSRLTLITIVSLLMSACGAGGGAGPLSPPSAGPLIPPGSPPPGSPPLGPSGVAGSVSNTRGGPAVQGATITAAGTTVSAPTDAQGAYSLTLNPGTFDILAAKSGMAASKFQSAIVAANKMTTANLIMFPVFDPTRPVAAPTISVSGLTQGQTISGTVSYTISVTAGNPVRRIDIRTSNIEAGVPSPIFSAAQCPTGCASEEFVDTPTANVKYFTGNLANGPAFVDIIAYDLNQNSAELVLPLTVNNSFSGTPPATPTGLTVIAVTTGQSLGLFSTQRAQLFTKLGIKQDPRILSVRSSSINFLAAPSNATLFVAVRWNFQTGAAGYKVFRSASPSGTFTQIAQAGCCFYDDADPSLAPGVTVYYAISAFNGTAGDSALTAAVGVTPLSAFNLNQASPVNNATGVSTTPTFTWAPNGLVGADQGYDIVVFGLNDSTTSWITSGFGIVDATSITYGTGGTITVNPLQRGKVYQWDIYEAEGLTVYGPNSAAVAIANGGGQVATGSLNGPFTFTTAP